MLPDARKYSILAVASLGSFLTPFMGAAVHVALPPIARDFGMDVVALGWVPTSYLLAAAALLVPLSRAADILGRRRFFLWGIGIYTAGSLLSGLAAAVAPLFAGRIVQGIGSAMVFGTSTAIITSAFPAEERGRALGLAIAAVYLGLTLGPLLGGLLTSAFGWRSVFLVNVPLGLLTLIWGIAGIRTEWYGEGGRFDLGGSVLYCLALTGLMYGFSLLPGSAGFALVAAGIAGIAGFVLLERRTERPVLDTGLFLRNRAFGLSNIAALVNYSATYAVGLLVSLYLQYTRGFTPRAAGVVLVATPLLQMLFSPLAGRLSDKVEPRIIASAGMGLTAVGLAALVPLSRSTPLGYVVFCLALLGLGFGLFSSPNTNAIMSSVEPRLYGAAAGTLATMRLVGQMLSLGLAMLLFSLFVGRVPLADAPLPAFITGLRTAFGLFAALCVAGIFASLARGRLHD